MYYLVKDPSDNGLYVWEADGEAPALVHFVQMLDKGDIEVIRPRRYGCRLEAPSKGLDEWITLRANISNNIIAQSPCFDDIIASAAMKRLNALTP